MSTRETVAEADIGLVGLAGFWPVMGNFHQVEWVEMQLSSDLALKSAADNQ